MRPSHRWYRLWERVWVAYCRFPPGKGLDMLDKWEAWWKRQEK